MNKQQIVKHSLVVFSTLAASLAILVPQSHAGTAQPSVRYACAPGTGALHEVSDLTGGILPTHQTGGDPKFTCLAASKPSGSDGHYGCTGDPAALHLVSDLRGGVLPQHQIGSPPHTCLQAQLPICAPFYLPPKGGTLTPGAVCIGEPK